MGKSNTEQLKIAEKYLGQGGAIFRKFCGLPSGAAWCDAYVSYIFNEAGNASLFCGGKKQTYCPTTIKLLAKELAQVPMYWAMPSDVILFDWEKNGTPNHIGFVRSKVSTSSINTIEGNTSNKVMYKTRPAKYVQAIYRPHFVPAKLPSKGKLDIDGDFAYRSIMMLQVVLGTTPDCVLGKTTISALQRKAGMSGKQIDGHFGPTTALYVQRMLIKANLLPKGSDDKEFGKQSTMALQKWINNLYSKGAETKPSTPTKPADPVKGYTGKYPTSNTNTKIINSLAYRYCYPYGTPQSKYKYKGGKPKPAYKSGIDQAYPKHTSWKNAKQRVGACCDVFVGSVLGHVGVSVPKDLKDQLIGFPKNGKLKSNGHYKKSDFRMGDVVQRGRKDYSGHTWIVCELVNGKKYVANAHYKHLGGCYAVMDATPSTITKSKWKYYGCYSVPGAIRTCYQKGDYGYDVMYIQSFLKWYGYDITVDGDFGDKTDECVRNFQKANGLTNDGKVGTHTIEKMKTIKVPMVQ